MMKMMKKMSWKRPVACLVAVIFSSSQLVPPAYALRPSASSQSSAFQRDFAQEFPEALAGRLGSANLTWQAEDIVGQAVAEGRAVPLAGRDARKPEEGAVSYLDGHQRRFPASSPPVESAALTSRLQRAGDALTQAFAQVSVIVDGQTVPASSQLQAVVILTEADDPALIGRVGDVRHRALIGYGAAQRSVPISLLQLEAFLEQGEAGRQALVDYLGIFAQSVVAGTYTEPDEASVARVNEALASAQQTHGQTDWLTHRKRFVEVRTQHALDYAKTINVSVGTVGTPTGGAITVTGQPLLPHQEAAINTAVRGDFAQGRARPLSDAELAELDPPGVTRQGGVIVYETPSLSQFDHFLVAHPGRGGEAFNHQLRQIYLSPARRAFIQRLSPEARREFWQHEVGHIVMADETAGQATEADVQARYPSNLVLAEVQAQAGERAAQLQQLQRLLQSEAFAREMAEWLDGAYYRGQGQTPPPFLKPEEETATVEKSVREEKIAMNVAGFYAVEAGIGVLSERTGQTPLELLQAIVDGTLPEDDMLLIARFANATWKAGQPFRALNRITRDTFRPAALLTPEELRKDFDQLRAAAGKLLGALRQALPAPSPAVERPAEPTGLQTQETLRHRITERQMPTYSFVKDAPILGYRITSARFEDLPEAIQQHLGAVDRTKYTEEYLGANIGSIIALQMKDATTPDFYVIGKSTFEQKYRVVGTEEVEAKNKRLRDRVASVAGMGDLLQAGDSNLVGALKTVPVQMMKFLDLGYSVEAEVTIQSPWGEQTKPAGQDAYLVFDESRQQFYMVNADAQGSPLSYVPTAARVAQTQEAIRARIEAQHPDTHPFVKDSPVLGYRVTSDRFEDIPEAIRLKLGAVDQTTYTTEYLRKVGIIILQMSGDQPDFYPIEKPTFDANYKSVEVADVSTKNAKLMQRLEGVEGMRELVASADPNLTGALKTAPVAMIRMSELGYEINDEVTIDAPWGGTQTKPVGQDAYLVFDTGYQQYYMVNTDASGNPIAYVPATPAEAPAAPDRAAQLTALQQLLQSETFAREMAEWLDGAYYRGQGQTPPPFLSAEEETKMVTKSVKEEKIAMNVAGFYAVEAGIGVLSERTGKTPAQLLKEIIDGTMSEDELLLIARFANATWKAGQPFRALNRITRDTFRPAALLTDEELRKDFDQIRAAAEKLLEKLQGNSPVVPPQQPLQPPAGGAQGPDVGPGPGGAVTAAQPSGGSEAGFVSAPELGVAPSAAADARSLSAATGPAEALLETTPAVTPAPGVQVSQPVATQAATWRNLLRTQGLNPDQLMDLEEAVKRAADLTQPVYVGVHSSAFFGAPDVAMALTAIQQAVAESLKGGKLQDGEHPPQSALRFVLLVDGATDAQDAKRIAEALAEALPEASGQAAKLNLELFALTLPAAIDQGRGQELFDLVSTLDGPTDRQGVVGSLIGPTEWVESFGHTVTTRQGHEVAAFGFDPRQQQDGKTLVPGGQLVVQAVTRAVEVAVTVKVETRPPDVMPDRQRVIVLPSLPLVGDLEESVKQYRQSLETKMRSIRATETKA